METITKGQRILVIRAGQLGDTVFATSIIRPLRAAFGPDTVIHWVAKRGMEGLFASDPRIERVFGLAHRNLPLALNRDMLRVVAASWREPYDILVNLEQGRQFLTLVRLVRARAKYGRPFRAVIDDQPDLHAVEHYRRIYALLVPRQHLAQADPDLVGAPPDQVRRRFDLPDRYLVVNPTNSHFHARDYRSHRSWPVTHWRELLERLAQERSETVVLIGGRSEDAYFRLLEPVPAGVLSLVGRTSLTELVGVLAGARALVTTDTGPSHLAAAVGTPVLAIFGPSDHRKTGPFATADNLVRILSAGLDCSPCSHTDRIRSCPDNRCMQAVPPERVVAELASVLDGV